MSILLLEYSLTSQNDRAAGYEISGKEQPTI